MLSVNALEFRRFKAILIQRNNQTITSVMFSFKNHSVVKKKFSCFALDPEKWRKRITGIFYLGGEFNIIFWGKKTKKFSGFIPKLSLKKKKKRCEFDSRSFFLQNLTPLYSESDLPIFDGFITFLNKSVEVLPIQVATENLWVSFSNFTDFSNQIKKQTKSISKNLRKSFFKNGKAIGEIDVYWKNHNPFFKDLSEDLFLELIFRKRI